MIDRQRPAPRGIDRGMAINWYPGHMVTARKDIRARLPEVDLLIEVLDARIPASSANPLVPELRGDKPLIQILNKADLADPTVTEAWLEVNRERGVQALAHHHGDPSLPTRVRALAAEIVAASRTRARPMLAMILGIPNVGKSTVINTLAGRNIARTANKPGVTTLQQRIIVGANLELLDTPGFLWPKLSPPERGYRLGVLGAITDRVLDLEDLAWFAVRELTRDHPGTLQRYYQLDPAVADEAAVLEGIGRRAGHLRKGGIVDVQKAAERLLFDLRSGLLGRISLESPPG